MLDDGFAIEMLCASALSLKSAKIVWPNTIHAPNTRFPFGSHPRFDSLCVRVFVRAAQKTSLKLKLHVLNREENKLLRDV